MTVDEHVKIAVGDETSAAVWGHLGRILHYSKGHNDQTDYPVAVLASVDDAGVTVTKLL